MLPAPLTAGFAGAASIQAHSRAHKELNPPGLGRLQSKENEPSAAPIAHICTAGRAPRTARGRSPASRALQTLPAFLGLSAFMESSTKSSSDKVSAAPRLLQPCACPVSSRLLVKLLRKRVLKFKPGVPSSPPHSGQEPPSPFPSLRSEARSQHLSGVV